MFFITVDLEYLITRASGIKSNLFSLQDYTSILSTNSMEDAITFISNNSPYKNVLSQYFTRYNPVITFIKAIHFENKTRWENLTNNANSHLKSNIGRIQSVIDLKNILTIMNFLPSLQDGQNLNLESLIGNLQFGGTISFYNWIELTKDINLRSLIGKTIFLAPFIHQFLLKASQSNSEGKLNLIALQTISNIAFFNSSFKDKNSIIVNELLAIDINIYLIRFLLRFKSFITENENFFELKKILLPWKSIKTFLGSDIFNYNQFEEIIISKIIENIKIHYQQIDLPAIDEFDENNKQLPKSELISLESLNSRYKLVYIKKVSLFHENNFSKILLVLLELIQEIENLNWIILGKVHNFSNDIILNKIFVLN